jgi:uncharacterized protein (DUF1330 family)
MSTRHEILVGLHVTDDESYDRYRAAMTPLLEARGGFFRVDYRVAEVLKGEEGVNRVFIISFPDEATKDAFFADPAYVAARAEHFEPAVAGGDIIAAYDVAQA